MSSETISGPWTVVEVTDTPKEAPVETRSTRAEVLASIIDIVHRRTGVDLTGEVTVEVDALTDEVTIGLNGVTLSYGGDIIAAEREYEWTGTITVEVTVEGTVTARNKDEAAQEAEDLLRGLGFDISTYDGDVTDQQHVDYHLWEVSEA